MVKAITELGHDDLPYIYKTLQWMGTSTVILSYIDENSKFLRGTHCVIYLRNACGIINDIDPVHK